MADVDTALPPARLLEELKSLEKSLGRRPRGRWGPREIDLDILYYGARVVRARALSVPHPRARSRKFVLKPLADLAPGFKDPPSGRSIRRLLAGLTDRDQRVRLYKKAIL